MLATLKRLIARYFKNIHCDTPNTKDDRDAAATLCGIESFRLRGNTGWYADFNEPCDLPQGTLTIDGLSGQYSDYEISVVDRCRRNGMLQNVEYLHINQGSVSDCSMPMISSLSSLRELVIDDNDSITDLGFKYLAGLRKLEKLSLWGSNAGDPVLPDLLALPLLTELDLSWTRISDFGLSGLHQTSCVKKLRLGGIPLTDRGLGGIQSLKSLSSLTVEKKMSRITDLGIAEFRSCLPDCEIHFA